MYNYLLDKDFLYELTQYQHKEIYAKIIALNFNELPIEQIEGRITGGALNIDGDSAVRRTCNLTLVAKDINISDFYWSVSNKFILEIGIKNVIREEYPDIVWFKQGVFVITSFNSSLTNNNYTISINGKDKMCLLNGDLGGNLNASIDFGKIDNYGDIFSKVEIADQYKYKANKYYIWDMAQGKYILSTEEFNPEVSYYVKDVLLNQKSLKLKDIIREAVHTYGKEMYHNIVINDLDNYGLELMEYRADAPLYMLYNEDTSVYDQMIDEDNAKNTEIKLESNGKPKTIVDCLLNSAVSNLNSDRDIFRIKSLDPNGNIIYSEHKYSATKIEYGHTAGYRLTDLIYAGELISSIGESLTSILDKIKNMLGAFEYFYDIDGKFVFQAKKIYSNNSWNPLVNADNNIFSRDMVEESPFSYSFEDINLIQKFQNTPIVNNIKNDYSIWGIRKSITGAEIPIHARYAIHKKPTYYKTFDGEVFTTFDIEEVIPKSDKTLLPDCLKEGFESEWWDIHDWAERYKTLTGEYPNGIMGTYGNKTCKLNLNKYFPKGTTWNPEGELFLFEVAADGTLSNISHNPGTSGRTPAKSCTSHRYTHFLERAQNGIKTYIYDPKIPSGIKTLYNKVDWREIIYQMAKDYYKHNTEIDFYYNIIKNNLKLDGINSYYPSGETGYEIFYTDIQGFWRDLYDINPLITYQSQGGYYEEHRYYRTPELTHEQFANNKNKYYIYDDDKKEYILATSEYLIYENCKDANFISTKQYYTLNDDKISYNIVENITEDLFNENKDNYYYQIDYYTTDKDLSLNETYFTQQVWIDYEESKTEIAECDYFLPCDETHQDDNENYSSTMYYWHKNVVHAPELLNFWIDFYEGDEDLQQYSIANIGDRPKVINNSKITSIYFRSVPQVIFIEPVQNGYEFDRKTGYTYIQLNKAFENLFSVSAQGKSAEEEINELMNTYSYCAENINLTTIPIYYLQPNTLIYIHDDNTGIKGKYKLSKISIPLTYNGMMALTAVKIINAIY